MLGQKVRVPIADYDPGRFAAGKQLSGAYGIGSISWPPPELQWHATDEH